MKTFDQLQEALVFFDEGLQSEDPIQPFIACGMDPDESQQHCISLLQETCQKTPLQDLYGHQTFPDDQTTFKLGGHLSALGHLHLDFVKADGAWQLQDLWQCR